MISASGCRSKWAIAASANASTALQVASDWPSNAVNAGDGAARVAQHFLAGVEIPYRPEQLPHRQGILRGQRQRADVAHECQSRTSPSPCVITVPGITLSRYGLSRSAANSSDVGPSFHIGMIAGS